MLPYSWDTSRLRGAEKVASERVEHGAGDADDADVVEDDVGIGGVFGAEHEAFVLGIAEKAL